jgi:hypothetical protein
VGKLVVLTLVIAALLALVAWRFGRMSKAQREKDAARKRWVIGTGGSERIALAPEPGTGTPIFAAPPAPERVDEPVVSGPVFERAAFLSPLDDPPSSSDLDDSPLPAPARRVMTPDGEMVLTAPPFALRNSILPAPAAALLHAIATRLPQGMILCPRVRLESLVEPTSPVDRDPDDWRQWRRRVRLRSVDAAVCRLEAVGWRPLLAIEIDAQPSMTRNVGPDRIVDDVLEAAGLPVVHLEADSTVEQAWTLIRTRLEA